MVDASKESTLNCKHCGLLELAWSSTDGGEAAEVWLLCLLSECQSVHLLSSI